MTASAHLYQDAYRRHGRVIWGLCYRMTGCAADADDLVQDTFRRALEKPPSRLDAPLRPWLIKVATNLSRDLLRKRRTKSYVGPWLPGPIESDPDGPIAAIEVPLGEGTTEARYDLMESVSFAFLLALEVLAPTKRAVLLLRDVFGYTVKETAEALDLSESNVKTTLHRARKEMEAYDRTRAPSGQDASAAHLDALSRFFTALMNDDLGALEAMLAEDVRALSDGGGEFHSALLPVIGREKVIRFYYRVSKRRGPPSGFEVQMLNGRPAVVATFGHGLAKEAPHAVFRLELDDAGRIRELHAILATRKLSAIRFP